MVPFDVKSLYTNVPVKEVITLATGKLFEKDYTNPDVDKDIFAILIFSERKKPILY